ncbi:plasmid replication protein RepC [Methylocystis sp. IM3]|uniref:plasmid replication protein RepC n=1 Tax=unclassified Methylocystis TaxID=2625913 RepID=UPI0030F6CC9F
MTLAQSNATGRRRDSATSWRVGKLFNAPLFAVSRRELLKAVRDAVRALALDRSERQLVECLAVCFGEQQLAHGLLCWPSNAQIEKKTGMSERTVRRTIVKLRERGLILMRDSANGKRFPISNAEGEVVDARGFDLTPLHARAAEFAERARALDIEDRVRRQLRDDLTAARNALVDLCAEDPSGVHAEILSSAKVVARPSKAAAPEEYAAAIEAYVALAEEVREIRYRSDPSTQTPGSAGHAGRHSEQNSKPSIEDCNAPRHGSPPPSDPRDDSSNEAFRERRGNDVRRNEWTPGPVDRAIPKDLALWLAACPELSEWGTVTTIERAATLGAQFIRACGLARHAFDAAGTRLGVINAGLLGLFVVQRHADGEQRGGTPIRSPGGLFVMLAREIERGRHPLEKELIAMQRRRGRNWR